MKIVINFMHDTLRAHAESARESRLKGSPPVDAMDFFFAVACGTFKVLPAELTELVETYQAYEGELASYQRVTVLDGILKACTASKLNEECRQPLEFFMEEVIKQIDAENWVFIEAEDDFLKYISSSIREVVAAHLPLMTPAALTGYFKFSRRFTHKSAPEFCEMTFNPATALFDDGAFKQIKTNRHPNQVLVALIDSCFPVDGRSFQDSDFDFKACDQRGSGEGIERLQCLAKVLIDTKASDFYLSMKYPDLVLIGHLVDRFAIAALSSPTDQERGVFEEAVVALVDLVTNIPEGKLSKEFNIFLTDGSGFNWFDSAVSMKLEADYLTSIPIQCKFTGAAGQALKDLNWFVVANALRVHELNAKQGYNNKGLIRGLLPMCIDRLLEKDSLAQLGVDSQVLLISNISDPALKKQLLVCNKASRAHVLSNDLGI